MAFKGVGLRCAPRRGRTSFGAGVRDATKLPGFPRRSQRGGTAPRTTSSRPDGGQSHGAGRAQPHVGPSSWPAAPFSSRHSRPGRPAHGWWLSATSPAPETDRPGPPAPGPPGEAAQPPPVSCKGLLAELGPPESSQGTSSQAAAPASKRQPSREPEHSITAFAECPQRRTAGFQNFPETPGGAGAHCLGRAVPGAGSGPWDLRASVETGPQLRSGLWAAWGPRTRPSPLSPALGCNPCHPPPPPPDLPHTALVPALGATRQRLRPSSRHL